jgi:hypothetical protein
LSSAIYAAPPTHGIGGAIILECLAILRDAMARGKVESNPAMEALQQHPRNFPVVLGARIAENGLGYFFLVFGLSYVITTVGVPKSDALSALMLAFTIELFAILGFATGPCPGTHACDCGVAGACPICNRSDDELFTPDG